jgi:hypothetical protein
VFAPKRPRAIRLWFNRPDAVASESTQLSCSHYYEVETQGDPFAVASSSESKRPMPRISAWSVLPNHPVELRETRRGFQTAAPSERYQAQPLPWLQVQPTFQYVITPGGG